MNKIDLIFKIDLMVRNFKTIEKIIAETKLDADKLGYTNKDILRIVWELIP